METRRKIPTVKLIQISFLLCFITFIFIGARISIDDEPTPLSGSGVSAKFYINIVNPDTNSSELCYAGKGYLSQDYSETEDPTTVSNYIISSPDCSDYLSKNTIVKWNTISIVMNKVRVIGSIEELPQDDFTFTEETEEVNSSSTLVIDSIHNFSNDNIYEGMVIQTLGYNSPYDNGGATYTISSTPNGDIDNVFVIAIDDNYYANLNYDNNYILNVASAGIFPQSKIANSLNTLIKKTHNKIAGIQFNVGTYYIEEPVYLDSMNYYGDDTVLSVSEDFDATERNVFLTKIHTNDIYDINFFNLTFLFETSTNSSLYGNESVLVALRRINSCTIDSCNFIARPSTTNGSFMPVCVLWFKQTDVIQNINITNTNIYNLTGQNYSGEKTDTLLGGGLLFSGPKDTTSNIFNNIKITNCHIKSTINDEALSFWNGNFNNVTINDCTITNSDHPSNNVATFYNGEFHNFSINKCSFFSDQPIRNVIKYRLLSNPSELIFNNCSIEINTKTDAPSVDTKSVLKIDSDLGVHTASSKLVLNSTSINVKSDKMYGDLIHVNNATNKIVQLTDCDVSIDTRQDLCVLNNTSDIDLQINNCSGLITNAITTLLSNSTNCILNGEAIK